jgi:hypothetical protein
MSGWDCLSRSPVSRVGEGLGLAARAAVYLSKPVGMKRVVQVIERLLLASDQARPFRSGGL